MVDVAAHVANIPGGDDNGQGPGKRLQLGESLYTAHCSSCHGSSGQGSDADGVPRLQDQHYRYLLRQFQHIRDGKRGNADADMMAHAGKVADADVKAVLDYVSRL